MRFTTAFDPARAQGDIPPPITRPTLEEGEPEVKAASAIPRAFHLALSSTTPPVFEPRLKTFKNRQRETGKEAEREERQTEEGRKKKFNDNKNSQLSKPSVIVFSKGNW